MTRTVMICLVATMLIVHPPDVAAKRDKEGCKKVKAQIQKIEAKMRLGYSAAQGIRYEEKLRELREKRFKLCR